MDIYVESDVCITRLTEPNNIAVIIVYEMMLNWLVVR